MPKVTQQLNLLYFIRFSNSIYLGIFFWGGEGVGPRSGGQDKALLPSLSLHCRDRSGHRVGVRHPSIYFLKDLPTALPAGSRAR